MTVRCRQNGTAVAARAAPPAVIVAAGAGRRMGRPKALVRYRGEPLAVRAARTFREAGCPDVVVVLGPESASVGKSLRALDGVSVVRVPDSDAPMFASVLAGVAAAPRATERGVLVHPVDVPRLAAATVSRFLAALAARDAPADAVTASFAGRRGHPIWISPARAAELRDAPADHPDGLRGWMRSRGRRVDAVDLADPAVLDDADTPADLEDDP